MHIFWSNVNSPQAAKTACLNLASSIVVQFIFRVLLHAFLHTSSLTIVLFWFLFLQDSEPQQNPCSKKWIIPWTKWFAETVSIVLMGQCNL